MKDRKGYIQYFKDYLNTLAGKLSAILAFAVLVIFMLSLFGASIPQEYSPLVYIVVIFAMLISAFEGWRETTLRREKLAWKDKSSLPLVKTIEAEHSKGLVVSSPEEARRAYLEAVIADNRSLRLNGLDPRAGDPTTVRLSLEDIYVALNTRTTVNDLTKKRMLDWEKDPLSVIEALVKAPDRRMVLLGLPGTGKSTFIRYIALRMAQELIGLSRKFEKWQGEAILPIAMSLGRFAETLPLGIQQGTVEMLEGFLISSLQADNRFSSFAPYILDSIEKEGALILFDGLDEVADLNMRPLVVQAVEAFSEKYKQRNDKSRFLVTCRTYSYQDHSWQLTKWPVHEIALLDPKQIEKFVNAWYDQHTQLDPSRANEYTEKRGKLLEALHPGDRRRLYEVAPFPLILTIMSIVHASKELPDSRAQVYMQCVELLLEKWQAKRSIQGRTQNRSILEDLKVPATCLYDALYEIAYKAHLGNSDQIGKEGNLITEGLVAGVIQDHFQDAGKLKTFLDYCQSANGLLMLQGTITPAGRGTDQPPRRVYTFPHLTFEEYLAGRHLEMEDGDDIRKLLDDAHDRWREVVKLLAEYLCFERGDRARMNGLLEALSTPFPKKPSDKDWRALWLAGEILQLYNRAIHKQSPFEDEIVQNLRRLVEEGALSPRERADAADVLDQFWQPEDLYTFIPIRSSTINQTVPFLIGKYPVTNGQYARFLTASDFAKQEFWVDFPKFDENSARMKETWGKEGWEWLQKNKGDNGVISPRYWDNAEFGKARPSAPVVGISWYEGSAYCQWLRSHWHELEEGKQGLPEPKLVRLPCEPEWVQAAGGEQDKERYAWDRDKATIELSQILQRTNIYEGEIGRTTPVWMFPLGASPFSVMDMTGNIWEWQVNCYDKDHDVLSLRGGSWDFTRGGARVIYRSGDNPYIWGDSLGFRVCLSR